MTSIIKAFNIDFNWDLLEQPASPGLYVHADPEEHVRWYTDLGANVIQSFCVAYDGYAWYQSKTVPVQPGMKGDFLQDVVDLAHQRGLRVMGYFNLAANPRWQLENPKLWHAESHTGWRIPVTEPYMDFFCESVRDALTVTNVDGFMVDWFNIPTRYAWLECEKQMYEKLMGEKFPSDRALASLGDKKDVYPWNLLPPEEQLEYDRRVMAYAWRRIREVVSQTREAVIWPNIPLTQSGKPLWTNHVLMKESDWILNESPDLSLLDWLAEQIGPKTKIIQNLCGWKDHDAEVWRKLDTEKVGLYGFAQADAATTLPWTGQSPRGRANRRNIDIIRRAYHEV